MQMIRQMCARRSMQALAATLIAIAVLGCCCGPIPLPLVQQEIGHEEIETIEIEMVAGPAALR